MSKKWLFLLFSLLVLVIIILYQQLKRPDFNLEKISVLISEADFEKLDKIRIEALNKGLLSRTKEDYVTCTVQNKTDTLGGQIRLKGDWVDHLKTEKWSFRVKLKDTMANGMKTFNLQSPKSRDFLNGYLFHKLLKYNNILSNEMTFVELIVNGKSWGIYNLEEHLSERMLKLHNRPEGLILSFDDTEFFEASLSKQKLVGIIARAKIKVRGSKALKRANPLSVAAAKKVMSYYQLQTDSVYEYFNPALMGNYYALCDLGRAYHAMGWINIRFFYNFDTQLMEPIGNDGYPVMKWGLPYLGHHVEKAGHKMHKLDQMRIAFSGLYNQRIRRHYRSFLNVITNEKYITEFLESEQSNIDFFEKEIQKEYKSYQYNRSFLLENAANIRSAAALAPEG